MKTRILTALSLVTLLGCATTAPAQLVEARDTYAKSSVGLSARLAPTELYDARKVLDKANAAFEADGDTSDVRDYAYIALRKVQLADVKARTAEDRERIANAAKQGVVVRDEQAVATRKELDSTRTQLKDERRDSRDLAEQQSATNTAQAQALVRNSREDAERRSRESADERRIVVMRDLTTIARVAEEPRGLVITLAVSDLFGAGRSVLTSGANAKLDQVATALQVQDQTRRIVVEGHTDNQGRAADNDAVSLARANAVRDYLVGNGVDSRRISALGMGSMRPAFSNSNAANRANNRRIEIVVSPASFSVR